jgi:beta-glucosidase
VVLLRNDGGLLPLARETRVAVIGEFARTPRFQGGGSSHINPTRVDNALEEMRALAADGADGDAGASVSFAPGFTLDGTGDAAALRREAVEAARAAEVAVVFLGLPEAEESEGFDRTTIDLPAVQLELLDAVVEANPRTVAVLSNGGVVALPFRDRVPAIIEGWLLGQAGGGATADVLYGAVNPSGKLTETIPLRLEDTPSFGNFPGELGHVRYGEGILVGYRWFDAKGLEVAFPFGHGLSYTTFEYGPASVEVVGPQGAGDEGGAGDLLVTVPVRNTGTVAGREVVQAYTSLIGPSAVARAPRELAGFASVELAAGETRNAVIRIRREDLAYWDIRVDRWVVEGGDYLIEIGASSRDLRSRATVAVPGDPIRLPLTWESSLADLLADPVVGSRARREVLPAVGGEDMERMMDSIPIRRLANFTRGGLEEALEDLLSEARAGR